MRTILIPTALVIFINSFGQTNYVKKYSGAYNIGLDGVEAYALREDGTCVWIYGWMSKGKMQTQQKSGNWEAKDGYIRVSINGNTGIIVEEYVLKNGRFVNKEDPSRYLKKRQS